MFEKVSTNVRPQRITRVVRRPYDPYRAAHFLGGVFSQGTVVKETIMFTPSLRPSPLMLAIALSASALAIPSLSQAATEAAKPATPVRAEQPVHSAKVKAAAKEDGLATKLSADGFQTMRDIRLARVSIFDGNTEAASDLLTQASKALDAVDTAAAKQRGDVQSDLLPIDGQIVVSDDFVDTPVKRQHIGKANEHLKQGQADKARDELRLAEVDASFSRILMPVDATRRHLNAAETLLKSDQFYEANLALKAAEDGLIIDTVAMTEVPTGNAAQAASGTATR